MIAFTDKWLALSHNVGIASSHQVIISSLDKPKEMNITGCVTVTKFNALCVSPSNACTRDQQGNVQHLVYVMKNLI